MKHKLSTILLALVFDKNFYSYIDSDFHFFFSYFCDVIEGSRSDWPDIFDEMSDDEWGAKYIDIVYDELENFY